MSFKQGLQCIATAAALAILPSLANATVNHHRNRYKGQPITAPPPATNDFPAASANGIFVIDGVHRNAIDAKIMNSSMVDGVLYQLPWSSAEPEEGNYNWSLLDAILAQAASGGKKVSVVFGAGWQTPPWVYAAGAKKFDFVWDHTTWGPPLCTTVPIPLPWDAIYLAKWNAFIAAAGARYNANPDLASIKVTGINSKTQEIFLPTSVNKNISSGTKSCTSGDDVANWEAAGYTRLKIESAWGAIIATFAQAFPDKKLEPMLIPGGFPAIDDNGNRFSAYQNQDVEVSNDILAAGVSEYPAQFTIQNDGWSAAWMWSAEAYYAGNVLTGYQEISPLKSQTTAAVNKALGVKAAYLEFYENDATDPSFQSALAAAHQILD